MNKKRNYGIDLLRIVSTFMIIILHILGAGGVIYGVDSVSPIYVTAWGMEFAVYCAVNCYALISGYVGGNSKFKLSNLLQLWLQVSFTVGALTAVFYFMGTSVSPLQLLQCVMPVSFRLYWYFTAYVLMYCFSPALNLMIQNASKTIAIGLSAGAMLLLSVVPTVLNYDVFQMNGGYCATWLMVLYVLGGFLKKYEDDIQIKKWKLFAGYLASVAVTLLLTLLVPAMQNKLGVVFYKSNPLMNYTSPLMVLASVCLLLLFAQIEVKKSAKVIGFVAPLTFGIYIIHVNDYILEAFITNKFAGLLELNPILFVMAVLLIAVVIFVGCGILEYLRVCLFRVCHISQLCKFIEHKIVGVVLWKK